MKLFDTKKTTKTSKKNSTIKKIYATPANYKDHSFIKSLEHYKQLYKESVLNPEKFWGEVADELSWFKHWNIMRQGTQFESKWFSGAKTNMSFNCLDRHLETWKKNKAAFLWEGENGDKRVLTYQILYDEVNKFSNVLKNMGIKKGDRVIIYMGMVPETAVALLSCARIGAIHTVVFAGYSAEALKDRILDSNAKLVIACDLAVRRGTEIYLKPAVDSAVEHCPSVKNVIVYKRFSESKAAMTPGRDHWWHELISNATDYCPPEKLDSEHPLFLLYTSGTTGRPKGILHTTAGYMIAVYNSFKTAFNPNDSDVYWCTADIGWSTGHSYGIYAPLLNGVTSVMYEGAPGFPDPGRYWEIVDKYKISIIYTLPTTVRTSMKQGEQWVLKYNLDSLKLIVLGGEPINPNVWTWVFKIIGKENCPVIDSWWQTETGSIMLAPIPGVTPLKPGSCAFPMPGVLADVVDIHGKPVKPGQAGYLVLKDSWPSMARTIFGSKSRYKKEYWEEFKGDYYTGDGAKKDKDGYFWILGRVDDVITVAGNRLGTTEIENALSSHNAVAEAAVVSKPSESKGAAIIAFITLKPGFQGSLLLKEELRNHVLSEIGHIARPDEVRFTEALPKTRNGKIVRRLLREIASGFDPESDESNIEDWSVVEKLREMHEEIEN